MLSRIFQWFKDILTKHTCFNFWIVGVISSFNIWKGTKALSNLRFSIKFFKQSSPSFFCVAPISFAVDIISRNYNPANMYLFYVSNRKTRNSCKIYSTLTTKRPDFVLTYFRPFSVSILDFEQVNVCWEVKKKNCSFMNWMRSQSTITLQQRYMKH